MEIAQVTAPPTTVRKQTRAPLSTKSRTATKTGAVLALRTLGAWETTVPKLHDDV